MREDGETGDEGRPGAKLLTVLGKWQAWRQARVDGVIEMNNQVNLRRLPENMREQGLERKEMDVGWLYDVNFEEAVEGWFNDLDRV